MNTILKIANYLTWHKNNRTHRLNYRIHIVLINNTYLSYLKWMMKEKKLEKIMLDIVKITLPQVTAEVPWKNNTAVFYHQFHSKFWPVLSFVIAFQLQAETVLLMLILKFISSMVNPLYVIFSWYWKGLGLFQPS